jgi:DNA-binding transcriptional MerR regulator
MVGPMASGFERTLGKYASVTIEAAARLVDVDVATIRHWSDVGSIEIEQRGDMDLVRLDQVRQLTTTSRKEARTRHGSLRALLRDAEKVESLNVSGLQQHVREKAGNAS